MTGSEVWAARVSAVPSFGTGLGFRHEIKDSIFASQASIDFLEVLVDQFISDDRELTDLREVCDTFQAIPHGVGLSVGSAAGLDLDYLRAIKRISDLTGSPYYSEHLCMTRAPGIDIGHLSPIWFTEETLRDTVRNVHQVQEFLDKPLVLENVTYLFDIPNASMQQAQFFSELVKETGCGVLLDVTNLHINSVNHKFNPRDFLDAMPLDRVVHVHLAGGYWSHGILVDSHSEPVQEGSWQLLAELCTRIDVKACVLEHDANFPDDVSVLIEQLDKARSIQKAQAEACVPRTGGRGSE
jgi:uncharacterized protein (UPF0276 family)